MSPDVVVLLALQYVSSKKSGLSNLARALNLRASWRATMAVDQRALIGTAVAMLIAGYWLLQRRNRHHLHLPTCLKGAPPPQSNNPPPPQSDKPAAVRVVPPPLYVFHCGEQPLLVEQFRANAQSEGFDVKIDTLDRFEAWVDDVRDWISNRASPCSAGRPARPPPCVFIISTGEDLEVTSKAAAACVLFLARKTNPSALLGGFRYAVLGLGDSNHLAASHRSISWASGKDCNQCGELFDRWLEQLGATRIVRRGESDLRTDHDALVPWMSGLWKALNPSF